METLRKISIKPGPPVEGDDFFGRENDLKFVWEKHILKGTSTLLSAPRRAGKTSFAKRMLEMAKKEKWNILYLDLQGIGSEADFVKLFKDTLRKESWLDGAKSKVGDTVAKLFESIEDFEIAGSKISINPEVWRNNSYSKIRELLESSGDILIVIDELTIFLYHLLYCEQSQIKQQFCPQIAENLIPIVIQVLSEIFDLHLS